MFLKQFMVSISFVRCHIVELTVVVSISFVSLSEKKGVVLASSILKEGLKVAGSTPS